MSNLIRSILIWDSDGNPTYEADLKILWSNFNSGEDDGVISLSKLVEDDSSSLRSRYLSWVYELGITRFNDKEIKDVLEIRPGFSFWWMTLIAQRTNAFESRYILDVVKLLALEDIFKKYQSIDTVILVTGNEKLITVLKQFSKKRKYKFESILANKSSGDTTFSTPIYRKLPYFIQAFLYLIKYCWRFYTFSSRNSKLTDSSNSNQVSVIDILVHLDKNALSKGNFKSNYWTGLTELLEDCQINTNWIHSYYKHDSVKTVDQALGLINNFNYSSSIRQKHFLVEADFNAKNLFRSIGDYIRVVFKAVKLRGVQHHFKPKDSEFNFWLFFRDDWNSSLYGTEAMINCIRLNLFESIFNNLPYQRLGIYIQENQPWEMAMIYSWKNAGHGKLIGVPHTTVRYWDLRYFLDERCYDLKKNNFPMPDFVAVNGEVAHKTYVEGGYPSHLIVKAEALRYLHLLEVNGKSSEKFSDSYKLKILVCGDILTSTNEKMLDWLGSALPLVTKEVDILVKPHPARSIDSNNYPKLSLRISNEPLNILLSRVDVALTSNITSAAVDAYFSGISVVSMLDGDSFNISPLRGLSGVSFVTNPVELASALMNSTDKKDIEKQPYFFLDRQLPLWRGLLSS